MTHVPKDVFTVAWRIENFSMCPHKKGEYLTSPTFIVDLFDRTKWHFELYPNGDDNSVVGYISLHILGTNKTKVTICVPIGGFSNATTMSVQQEGPERASVQTIDNWGFLDMAYLQSLAKVEDIFHPNDTFTIHCRMRRFPDVQESLENMLNVALPPITQISLEELSSVISDDIKTTEYYPTKCSFCTIIPVERREITWTIKDFKNRTRSSQKIPISVLSAVREKSALLLSCYVSGDWNGKGGVRMDIHRKDGDFKQTRVKCRVSVIDRSDVAQVSQEDEHLFGEDYDVWTFPQIVNLNFLETHKSDLLEGNELSLRCEFLISYEGEEATAVGGNLRTCDPIEQERNLGHDMNELLQDPNFADVTLISEDLELAAHKSVLCARSPVFRAMLSGDTQENGTGVVRISDIDAETVKNMRNFLYKGFVLELKPEDALKLYSAADKYQILKLKKQCACSIKYNLSLSTVCDVLILADMHQDSDLGKYVESFLCVHANDVFQSTEWKDLMKKNLQLAAETMQKALTKISQFYIPSQT